MLCCLCLFGIGESKPIALFINNESTELAKIIEHNKLIKVSMEESVFANICQKCLTRLNDFYDFCKYVKERQCVLIDQESKIDTDPINAAIDIKSECSDNEYGRPCDDDQHNATDRNDDEKLNKSPLSEAEYDFDDYLANVTGDMKDDILQAETTKEPSSPLMKTKQLQNNSIKRVIISSETEQANDVEDNSTSLIRKNKRKYKKQKCTDAAKTLEFSKKSNDRELSGSEYDAIIAKHLSIKCELCDIVEDTFLKLQIHFRTMHKCAGYLRCCGKFFKKRLPLAEHIRLHLNPASFQCKLCPKIMKSSKYLRKHMDDKHPAEHQLKYKCDQCDKAFAHKQIAERHRETHTKEKNYQCQECKKCLKTKYGLSKHMDLQHSDTPKHYICDICGRVFKFQPSFKRHVAEHQGIVVNIPTHQCDLCGEWFTRIGLNKHMDRHNHIDVKCDICGKVNVSKTALRHHLERYHKELKILNCPFCEKTFTRKRALQEHIAIHTDEKHYVCKFCNKEFRSSANMYSHRKRNHAKELELEKLSNKKRPPVVIEQLQQ